MQESQETQVWSLGLEDPLEEVMATHSSILAWRIPWTEEPGGQQSIGSQRVGHDLATEKQQQQITSRSPSCMLGKGWSDCNHHHGWGKDRLSWGCWKTGVTHERGRISFPLSQSPSLSSLFIVLFKHAQREGDYYKNPHIPITSFNDYPHLDNLM